MMRHEAVAAVQLPAVPRQDAGVPNFLPAGQLVTYRRPVEWVIDGMLPTRSLTLVAGDPKLGQKTMAMLWLALRVATGQEYLGHAVPVARPIIYSFLEDDPEEMGERFSLLGLADGATAPIAASFRTEGFEEALTRVTSWRAAVAKANAPAGCAGVWIIDPLIELTSLHGVVDENSPTEIRRILRPYRELAYASGWAIVVVHHNRKAGDEMRGSSDLKGVASGWWAFRHKEGVAAKQIDWVMRRGAPGQAGFEMRFAPGAWSVVTTAVPGFSGDGWDEVESARKGGAGRRGQRPGYVSDDEIRLRVCALFAQDVERLRGRPQIGEALRGSGFMVGTDRLGKVLATMVETGELLPSEGRAGHRVGPVLLARVQGGVGGEGGASQVGGFGRPSDVPKNGSTSREDFGAGERFSGPSNPLSDLDLTVDRNAVK